MDYLPKHPANADALAPLTSSAEPAFLNGRPRSSICDRDCRRLYLPPNAQTSCWPHQHGISPVLLPSLFYDHLNATPYFARHLPPPDVASINHHDDVPRYSYSRVAWHHRFSQSMNSSSYVAIASIQLQTHGYYRIPDSQHGCYSQHRLNSQFLGRVAMHVAHTQALALRQIQHFDPPGRSEEHTSELQSRENLVCRLLLEKKNQ